jgi:hypothetical protein
MTRRAYAAVVAVIIPLAAAAAPASAERLRLDDTLSPTPSYVVDLGWRQDEIVRALGLLVAGDADAPVSISGRVPAVEVRLDTREFVGRPARIFLTLPRPADGTAGTTDLELRWEASGNFLAGTVQPGQSTLVFDGIVGQGVTSVVFDFLLVMDNGFAAGPFELEPVYEIELDD